MPGQAGQRDRRRVRTPGDHDGRLAQDARNPLGAGRRGARRAVHLPPAGDVLRLRIRLPRAPRGQDFFAEGVPATIPHCTYFSFTTLATIGYGDLTAASNLGHTLSVSEGLLGQVYLVTVVSLIVGNLGRRRPPGERVEDQLQDPTGGSRPESPPLRMSTAPKARPSPPDLAGPTLPPDRAARRDGWLGRASLRSSRSARSPVRLRPGRRASGLPWSLSASPRWGSLRPPRRACAGRWAVRGRGLRRAPLRPGGRASGHPT